MRPVYLSLGSNVGDRGGYLRTAVADFAREAPLRCSHVFATSPWGGVEQDDFWNMVLEWSTDATAANVLARCQAAELRAGRERLVRWGPRTLDVDIILIEGETVATSDLVVPHPRMLQRRFVLAPLRQLRPDLITAAQVAAAEGAVVDLGRLEALD